VENQNLIHTMGEASRKKAETEFDVENVINRHLEIYKELIK
jgi:glycosyltransferase involved in cell wall biosynthesis